MKITGTLIGLSLSKATIELSPSELAEQLNDRDILELTFAVQEKWNKIPNDNQGPKCEYCGEPKEKHRETFIDFDGKTKCGICKSVILKPAPPKRIEPLKYYWNEITKQKCLFPDIGQITDKINELINYINKE